ncbi:hypothetical protein QBC33DRAFT_496016, partial [Phialemonium atrogriseum]
MDPRSPQGVGKSWARCRCAISSAFSSTEERLKCSRLCILRFDLYSERQYSPVPLLNPLVMASPDSLQQVFDAAKREFEEGLPSNTAFRDILAITSVKQVWDATDKLQREQRHLRHLERVKPFLDRLSSYEAVISIFIQVKPEVLALVWGPVRLLLLWASEWQQGFDAIVKTIERIGELLPQFPLEHFLNKESIKGVLGLFYRDILDFYLETLKFFSLPRRKIMFETLWPKRKERIKVVEANIERHARLLGENITFEHIRREEEARIKSFAEIRESEVFRGKQKFQALETAICPQMYDDRLDWLRRRACPGTERWLARDQVFSQWMDMGSQLTRLLWLQGIPGAGKTFLACWVVTKAKEKGRTLYAFPSHVRADTTAISIIHTLLFQLASDDSDLQALLTDTNKRDLKSNVDVAKDLLTTALKCAGGTFMVIDGLDEVEEFERKQFLYSLLDVSKACRDSGLKICISSRAENDMVKILQSKATQIRVDRRNAVGIQTYVNSRFDQWMASTDFLAERQSEINALLSPISTKAKGMFLYARIVIDNVVDLNNIDDIRRELRALPEDLDAAYERALSRIDGLSTRNRDTVKRILGWIGCSPVPLTLYELEQAILVSVEACDDAPVVDSSLNIVKLCGPIVEVVDETPQFVHFTVKEYIFNHRTKSVSVCESTMDLLVVCLTYLCYNALGEELDEDQLRENLLAGKYRLQAFASSTWFTLVKRYIQLTQDENHLVVINGLLENLFSELGNPRFRNDIDEDTGSSRRPYQPGHSPWPEAPEFVSQTLLFYKDRPKDLWTSDNAQTWTCLDPLTVSDSCARVEAHYNSLLCHEIKNQPTHKKDCVCAKLQRHYGKYLFKCHFFSCPFRRDGFETDTECGNHMTNHSRPWKCSVKSCDFSIIGFPSCASLEQHRQRLHRVVRESAFIQPSESDDEALYTLIYGLLSDGDIDELEAIWPACRQKVNQFTEAELIKMAAGQGSLQITQLFLEWDDQKQEPRNAEVKFGVVIHDAVQSGNLELTRWILEKGTAWGCKRSGRYRDVVVAVLKSDSGEVFDIWENIVKSTENYNAHLAQELFEKTVLNTAKRFPEQEMRMVESWRLLSGMGRVKPPDLGRALTMVAQTTCSVEQAKVLLELGAPIDYPQSENSRGYTALHWASKKTSEEAAHLMKFLLFEGAKANTRFGSARPEKEEGARKIETWLGLTWDKLAESAGRGRGRQGSRSSIGSISDQDE